MQQLLLIIIQNMNLYQNQYLYYINTLKNMKKHIFLYFLLYAIY